MILFKPVKFISHSQTALNEDGFYEKCLSYSPKATFGVVHVIHHSLGKTNFPTNIN